MKINERIDNLLCKEIERLSNINEFLLNKVNQLREENGRLNKKIEHHTSANGAGSREPKSDAQDHVSAIRRALQEAIEKRDQEQRRGIFIISRGEGEDFPTDFIRSIFGSPLE